MRLHESLPCLAEAPACAGLLKVKIVLHVVNVLLKTNNLIKRLSKYGL